MKSLRKLHKVMKVFWFRGKSKISLDILQYSASNEKRNITQSYLLRKEMYIM